MPVDNGRSVYEENLEFEVDRLRELVKHYQTALERIAFPAVTPWHGTTAREIARKALNQ